MHLKLKIKIKICCHKTREVIRPCKKAYRYNSRVQRGADQWTPN